MSSHCSLLWIAISSSHLKVMSPFGGSIGIGENCFVPSFRRSFPHDRTDDKKSFSFYRARVSGVGVFLLFQGSTEQNTFSGVERTHCMENAAWRKFAAKTGDSNVMSGDSIEPTLGQLVLGFVFASRLRSPRNIFSSRVQRFHLRFISRASTYPFSKIARSAHKWITWLLIYLLPFGTYTFFVLRSSEWRKK